MKKALLALAVILILAGVIWWSMSSGTQPVTATEPVTASSTSTEPSGTYADGTYTGPAENAVYGTVQVVAVISGGKLTAVNLLQYPDAPGHTTQVNQAALPQLQQEALSIQSGSVDIVSGATQTSEAFQASLTSALAQAS